MIIEKDIPVADRVRGRRAVFKTIMEKLEVGESFLVPPQYTECAHISSMYAHYRKKLKRNFTCRKTDEGIRVWRTA